MDSTFTPMVKYLENLNSDKIIVEKLENIGPRLLWSHSRFIHSINNNGFFLTDGDIDLSETSNMVFDELVKISLKYKQYKNKPMVIQIMGTWCPNCMDETDYLSNIYDKYNKKGLEFLAIDYERTTDFEKAKYNVNAIVVDGAVWAKILTYKASTSGEFTMPMGVVTISPIGQLIVCGVPVYVASWVGGDEAIICDTRFFEIIQSEGLSLQFFDQDDNNVQVNKITARIEASVGFAVLDPAAISVLSLESFS
jgi:thiol-disulfide isomerase/thioredoxin